MSVVIDVQKLGKLYRLGEVGTGTLSHDLKRWWASVRGLEDPFSKVGKVNERTERAKDDEYVWALRDISFQINQGDVVGVIGRNGAGKSTLLKILSRITSPSAGEVKIKGRIASLLEVGTGFHQEMTGRENVFMNGTVMGMRRYEIARKFDEIVDFAGVAKYVDTPVKRYSSGMMVRLGFAVAAFLEPEILIVDEVLAVGDAEFQRKAIGKMQDVSKGEGRTVLFVSHNMASIQNLCQKAILLSSGTVIKNGSVDDVISYYLNAQFEKSNVNLSDRKDRSGTGIIKFLDIAFEDTEGKQTNSLYSGINCSMVVKLDNSTGQMLEDVVIAVGIDDSQGKRLTVFSNELTNQEIKIKPHGSTEIRIKINSLPLQSDTYFMTLFSTVKGEITDWISNAAKFHVENGDYFNTGRIIQKGHGSILINHEFFYR